MKKTYKLFAITLALVMLIALVAIPASAFTYDAVAGGTTTFTTTLDNNGAPVPAWTVTYAIGSGSGTATDGSDPAKTFDVIPGPNPGKVKLKIGEADATEQSIDVTYAAGDAATKTVTVDFSTISFTEPGVYRYTVTQSATALAGMTLDEDTERNIDVWVYDNGTGLAVSAFPENKAIAFNNTLGTNSLTISKNVEGIFASRDKYFAITVTVTTALPDDSTYTVTLPATASDSRNPEGPLSKTDLTAGVTFYLQHGQSVTIAGLPYGAEYTVIENPDGYTSNQTDNTVRGTIAGAAATAAFVNTKDGHVPTGVLLTVIPGAVLLGAGVVGFLVMSRKRKNEDEAEEE